LHRLDQKSSFQKSDFSRESALGTKKILS